MAVRDQGHGTHRCLSCWLTDRGRDDADRDFLLLGDRHLAFGELAARSATAAGALRAAGARPGDVIATVDNNSVEHVVAMFACVAGGFVWAPINPMLGPADLPGLLERLAPRIVLVTDATAEAVRAVDGEWEVRALGELDGPMPQRPLEPHHWADDEVCWIVHSGATTGAPKALELPHGYGLACSSRLIRALALARDDRFYSTLQMYHAWLPLHVLNACLRVGATVATRRWFSASSWADDVEHFAATVSDPFIAMIAAVLRQPVGSEPSPRAASLRTVIGVMNDGTPNGAELRARFADRFNVRTINIYGLTECGGLVTAEGQDDAALNSCGTAAPEFEVAIVDDAGRTLPAGQVGEIAVRPRESNITAVRYRGDAESAAHMWHGRWIHTGDFGRLDGEGRLFYEGRDAFWLRRKGENFSAVEVERVAVEHAHVEQAAVVSTPSELGEDEVRLFVTARAGTEIDLQDVHTHIAERLAYFKVPRFIDVRDELPTVVKGDIDRQALRALPLDARTWDAGPRRAGESAERRHRP